MQTRLGTAYRTMKPPSLIIEAGSILAAMPRNPAFAGEVPSYVASAAQLKEAIDKLRDAFEAAITHDSIKIRARNAAQAGLVLLLDGIAKHIECFAVNNPAALFDTGFTARRGTSNSTTSTGSLMAPSSFTVRQGPQSGTMVGKVSGLASAKSIEVHVAEGDPLVEANWSFHGVYVGGSFMLMSGFNPGTQYSLRARGINSIGAGAWSAAVSLMGL